MLIPIPAFPSPRFTAFISQSPHDYLRQRPLSWHNAMVYLCTSQNFRVSSITAYKINNYHLCVEKSQLPHYDRIDEAKAAFQVYQTHSELPNNKKRSRSHSLLQFLENPRGQCVKVPVLHRQVAAQQSRTCSRNRLFGRLRRQFPFRIGRSDWTSIA
jgi:hypothetical protein